MERNSSFISAAYSLLRNRFYDIDAQITALQLLHSLGQNDIKEVVAAYNYHIGSASADLTNSQKEFAKLTLQSIKD